MKTRLYYGIEEIIKIVKEYRENGGRIFLNQIIYIKQKEESINIVLLWMKAQEKIAEITTIEERKISMMERVGKNISMKVQKLQGLENGSHPLAPPCVQKQIKKIILQETIENELAYM